MSSATACTTCSRASRTSASRASTASSGTRSSCPASSWRTSAGNGTCCATMTRHVDTGAAAAARAVRQDARREELPERPAIAAPARVRAVRHAPALATSIRRARSAAASCSRKCARRSRCSCRRRTTASRTASRTSSPAATRRATTATSGPKCFRPMPTASSRRTACSIAKVGRALPRRDPRRGRQPPGAGVVQRFRGREPNIDALLRHSGMIAA